MKQEAMVGQTLGHDRITPVIGAGGMGQVYRATDTKLGRDVALKVLPPETAADPARLDQVHRVAEEDEAGEIGSSQLEIDGHKNNNGIFFRRLIEIRTRQAMPKIWASIHNMVSVRSIKDILQS